MAQKTVVFILSVFCAVPILEADALPQSALLETQPHASIRPSFSWDTVPQWLIVRKSTGFTDEEVRLIGASPIVVLEKANGYVDNGSVEDGVLRAARAVKAANPKTVTLFYWNAVINYPHYRANEAFLRNLDAWGLKKEGKTFLFKGRYPIYNLTDRGLQDWWITTAKVMAGDPALDGIMIDAICKTVGVDDGRQSLYTGKEYGSAYFAMGERLKEELGNKLLIGNAIRVSDPQFNMHHLKYLDGSYVERWAVPMGGRTFEDYVAEGMAAMSQALATGKIILFNANPKEANHDVSILSQSANIADKEKWMKQHIGFPLAVFLMVAEPGAYFHWGTGPDALPGPSMDIWRNDIYEELRRPLGKPLGPAANHDGIYTRRFEHLAVRLDLKSREASFDWH